MTVCNTQIVRGTILNPINSDRCDFYHDGALVLKKNPKTSHWQITEIGNYEAITGQISLSALNEIATLDFRRKLILPPFFDAHFHWVQEDVRHAPKMDLIEWLKGHTWPHEETFADPHTSQKRAKDFKKELLKNGTLGGFVWGSPHPHTVDHALENFVGDYIAGNANMIKNSPAGLGISEEQALQQVEQLCQKWSQRYAFTPRLGVVMTPGLMQKGSKIAEEHGSFIQTHLSETNSEIDWVIEIFRKVKGFETIQNYTEVYHRGGLLTDRSILGHCIHLNDDELKLIADTNSVIAHCPSSNASVERDGLGSGRMALEKILDLNIRWALGSDIGGGPWLSMFDVMRSFIEEHSHLDSDSVNYCHAFYRSTLATPEIMKKDHLIGNFAAGKEANFIVVEPSKECLTHIEPDKLEKIDKENTDENNTKSNQDKNSQEMSEAILKSLIESYSTKREKYSELVTQAYHRGESCFQRNENE